MAQRKQSKGACAYCDTVMSKSGMVRHLNACPERRAAIEGANQKKGSAETLYHLRVQDGHGGDFWLDLEVRGSATLDELDFYLRRIWLDCCGHMSQFSIGGWRGDEIPMDKRISQVFKPGTEITHIYDFGTSSITLIKLASVREGKPSTSYPIALMARNLIPEPQCIKCENPAGWLCMECVIEEGIWGFLCDEHSKKHPHREYGRPIRLVNSPRLGMCGYTGPAEPPY